MKINISLIKLVFKSIILSVISFTSMAFGSSFFLNDNNTNIAINFGEILRQENDVKSNYSRVVAKLDYDTNFDNWVNLTRLYNYKSYKKSVLMGVKKIDLDNLQIEDTYIGSYSLHSYSPIHVLEDLKFVEGFGLEKDMTNKIIVFETLANTLMDTFGYATYSQVVEECEFCIGGSFFKIGAIAANNDFQCSNKFYFRLFPNIALIPDEIFVEIASDNCEYYFTLCGNSSYNLSFVKGVSSISTGFTFENIPINNINYNGQIMPAQQISNLITKQMNSIPLIILGIVLWFFSICLWLYILKKFLLSKIEVTHGKKLILVVLSIAISFLIVGFIFSLVPFFLPLNNVYLSFPSPSFYHVGIIEVLFTLIFSIGYLHHQESILSLKKTNNMTISLLNKSQSRHKGICDSYHELFFEDIASNNKTALIYGNCFFTNSAGGTRMHSLAKALVLKGFNVVIYAWSELEFGETIYFENNIIVISLGNPSKFKKSFRGFLSQYSHINPQQVLKNHKPDLVYIYSTINFVQAKFFRNKKVKYNYSLYFDVVEFRKPSILHPIRTIKYDLNNYIINHFVINEKVDGITCVSKFIYDYFVCKKKCQSYYLPITFPYIDFKKTNPLNTNGCVKFIYAGSPINGVEPINKIISAFAAMKKRGANNFLFICCGFTLEDAINKHNVLISDLHLLSDSIVFLGEINKQDLHHLYETVDYSVIFRNPNKLIAKAGFPTKLIESIALGVPPVLNDFGDCSFYFKKDNPLFCNKYDILQFSRTLEEAIELRKNIQNYEKLINIANKLLHDYFSQEICDKTVLKMLNENGEKNV